MIVKDTGGKTKKKRVSKIMDVLDYIDTDSDHDRDGTSGTYESQRIKMVVKILILKKQYQLRLKQK